MKKILFPLITLVLVLVSCSKNSTEVTLQKYVVDRAAGVDVKYKLTSYQYIDTITNESMVDSLITKLPLIKDSLSLNDFMAMRNQEFEIFRAKDENYEEKIRTGELKDASPWCTEIRTITEQADSLIANWDKVNIYSYDYNRLHWWYTRRASQYYGYNYELSAQIEAMYKLVLESENQFFLLDSLQKCDKKDVFRYVIKHDYSIYNPLLKSRIDLCNNVYLDSKMNYVSSDSKTDVVDIINSLMK